MNIIDFRTAQAMRETPAPRRITDKELEALRTQAEFQALGEASPAWRNLVDALVELQDRRWSERNG
jgi:hypothetical protein